jgi:broad-specificity NMP kinase
VVDLHVCVACGGWSDQPEVLDGEPVLVCGVCGCRRRFLRLPLFAVTGPSGAGKSTVGPLLAERLGELALVVEQDVLWTGALRDDVPGHPVFRSTWLRMAAMLHQNGRPVVLCGTVAPAEFEYLPERVFFSDIHYLALVSEPEALRKRLLARPAWREWDEERVEEMLEFNEWLQREAPTLSPPVELFDTTHIPVETAVDRVEAWVRGHLGRS